MSQEYRVLAADDPTGEWQVVQPRERDLEYGISHYGDHFYVVTNLGRQELPPDADPGGTRRARRTGRR